MQNTVIRYNCVGCGICCKGRLIPLTLNEAEQWLARGHDVAVVLEAFNELTWPADSKHYAHSAGRSVAVNSAESSIRVIAVFVGNALEQCPNLRADNLCGIYEERPLVCRIYPMEINPFIEMSSDNKICPPESWGSGDILCTDGVANPELQALVNRSRQADVEDAATKIAVCAQLGIKVASWKENAFAVYFPERLKLIDAIRHSKEAAVDDWTEGWKVRADDSELRKRLMEHRVTLASSEAADYIFHRI
ncbi:YkgJ family cysteine cluster protein [Pseudomonas cichorii]|uniref:YkgJ family cysteine cluster protein n=1 Tax=Pseudomonas cichorii TaxID=36746 RepID=UPI001C89FEBA|nr:YkgJ family cysteine cluster protein [Pseudomonas cichorii]MBX8516389.1 YkgJ family cysteine cluster protein [Pseudomonas cichorii]